MIQMMARHAGRPRNAACILNETWGKKLPFTGTYNLLEIFLLMQNPQGMCHAEDNQAGIVDEKQKFADFHCQEEMLDVLLWRKLFMMRLQEL